MTRIIKRPTSMTYLNNFLDNIFNDTFSNGSIPNMEDIRDKLSHIERLSNYPEYPPINHFIMKNGDTIIEIAAQGFSKEDISISVEDRVLTVDAGKNKSKLNEDESIDNGDMYCIHRKLSKRKFSLAFVLSDKIDIDNIDVSLDLGILKLTLPMKEEEKHEVKTLEIK